MCLFFRNMMDVYAEGRLADFEARRLERHIASCPACAAELAARRRLYAELHSIPTPPPPKALKAMIQAAAEAAKRLNNGYAEDAGDCPRLLYESAAAVLCSTMILALSLSISFSRPDNSAAVSVDSAIQ